MGKVVGPGAKYRDQEKARDFRSDLRRDPSEVLEEDGSMTMLYMMRGVSYDSSYDIIGQKMSPLHLVGTARRLTFSLPWARTRIGRREAPTVGIKDPGILRQCKTQERPNHASSLECSSILKFAEDASIRMHSRTWIPLRVTFHDYT